MMRELTGRDIEAASIAVDVRKAADQGISHKSALNLELELHRRDDNERATFGKGYDPVGNAVVFDFDFSRSQLLRDGVVSIDYSLVRIEPGVNAPDGSAALHYVGVRLERGSLKIIDLGPESEIHALCEDWLSKLCVHSTNVARLGR